MIRPQLLCFALLLVNLLMMMTGGKSLAAGENNGGVSGREHLRDSRWGWYGRSLRRTLPPVGHVTPREDLSKRPWGAIPESKQSEFYEDDTMRDRHIGIERRRGRRYEDFLREKSFRRRYGSNLYPRDFRRSRERERYGRDDPGW